MNDFAPERWIVSMLASMIACIAFTATAQTPGPRAMPEMLHRAERDDRLTDEPRPSRDRSRGLYQYDLDSIYLPDVAGGYVEILYTADNSTVAAENDELLREIATLLKERGEIEVWVTARLETDSKREERQTFLAVDAIVGQLRRLGFDDVPFRIWQREEEPPDRPIGVLEIRVLTSAQRRIS